MWKAKARTSWNDAILAATPTSLQLLAEWLEQTVEEVERESTAP
jgi:hypothetical protein